VADFLSYSLANLKQTLDIFKDCFKQFIFISSAAVYSNLSGSNILEEDKSLVGNNVWSYGCNKILCENHLKEQRTKSGLDYTIVRPSFTYNRLRILYPVGPAHQKYSWTIANRILKGKPLPMHGDGNALAAAMSTRDFAKAFVGLCGNTKAYGQAYHIASEDFHTWNRLAQMIGEALGMQTILCHIPAHVLGFELGSDFGEKLNHFSFSHIFSMDKIRTVIPDYQSTIPFYNGIRECISFYESNPQYKVIDKEFDRKMDYLINKC
jgi:nucleoside-diphosphate-sugar epimerase